MNTKLLLLLLLALAAPGAHAGGDSDIAQILCLHPSNGLNISAFVPSDIPGGAQYSQVEIGRRPSDREKIYVDQARDTMLALNGQVLPGHVLSEVTATKTDSDIDLVISKDWGGHMVENILVVRSKGDLEPRENGIVRFKATVSGADPFQKGKDLPPDIEMDCSYWPHAVDQPAPNSQPDAPKPQPVVKVAPNHRSAGQGTCDSSFYKSRLITRIGERCAICSYIEFHGQAGPKAFYLTINGSEVSEQNGYGYDVLYSQAVNYERSGQCN